MAMRLGKPKLPYHNKLGIMPRQTFPMAKTNFSQPHAAAIHALIGQPVHAAFPLVANTASWRNAPAANASAASTPSWVKRGCASRICSMLSSAANLSRINSTVIRVPATAPGRAQAPTTPPWESALSATLAALGLQAGAFEAQWARLATLRG